MINKIADPTWKESSVNSLYSLTTKNGLQKNLIVLGIQYTSPRYQVLCRLNPCLVSHHQENKPHSPEHTEHRHQPLKLQYSKMHQYSLHDRQLLPQIDAGGLTNGIRRGWLSATAFQFLSRCYLILLLYSVNMTSLEIRVYSSAASLQKQSCRWLFSFPQCGNTYPDHSWSAKPQLANAASIGNRSLNWPTTSIGHRRYPTYDTSGPSSTGRISS